MNTKPLWQDKTAGFLLTILLLAAFLRLYGVEYGLPHHYLADEPMEIHRALKLGAGQWDWDLDRTLKGFYFYVLFVEYGLYFLLLFLAGKVQSAGDFALRFAADPTPFYLMGRVTTAILGTVTVGVLYPLTRRLGGSVAAALASCLFLAVAVQHVDLSHSVTLDVPLTFFATLSYLFVLRITEDPSRRNYLLCSLCCTLATLTKVHMAVLFLPFLAAHFWPLTRADHPPLRSLLLHRRLLGTLAGSLALYVVANPGIVVNAGALLERIDIFFGSAKVPDRFVLNYTGPAVSGFAFYASSFLKSFGFGIASLGAGGMLLALFSRDRRHWVFLGFFLLFVGILAQAKGMFSHRYALPVFPLFALYAGVLLARIFGFLRAPAILVWAAALLLTVEPFSMSLARDLQYTRTDTRTLALEWFQAHVPPGSRVLIYGHRTFPNFCTVPLTPSAHSVAESISRYDEAGDRKATLLKRFLQPSLRGPTYHLILASHDERRLGYEDYRALGAEYAVVCDCEDDLFLTPQGRKKFPWIADIYLRLMNPAEAVEIARFERSDARPGPEIRVYRILDPSPSTANGPAPLKDSANP